LFYNVIKYIQLNIKIDADTFGLLLAMLP